MAGTSTCHMAQVSSVAVLFWWAEVKLTFTRTVADTGGLLRTGSLGAVQGTHLHSWLSRNAHKSFRSERIISKSMDV